MKNIIPVIALVSVIYSCNTTAEKTSKIPQEVNMSQEDSLKISDKITSENPHSSSVMDLLFGKPKYEISTIGVLVYDGVNDLDMMGPRYILGQAMGVKTKLIALKEGNIKTTSGVEIVPSTVIDSISELDILVIPGGFKGTIEAVYNEDLHEWIKKIDEKTVYTAGVCTGVWILGATGLLENKRASTNWYREKEFLEKFKAVPVDERYTKDGKYWTSAGVTAGMDMSLAIMKDIYGDRYTQGIMLDMEYDPYPPIEGGTPENTNWAVSWMMKTMYDGGVNPLIDSLEALN